MRLLTFCFWTIASISAVASSKLFLPPEMDAFSDEAIDFINNRMNTTWKAVRNFPASMDRSRFRSLTGAKLDGQEPYLPVRRHNLTRIKIPKSFDARAHWPNCASIGAIGDQGDCGSCWAYAAANTMSDRICVATRSPVNISVQDILTCCGKFCGEGCGGGYLTAGWLYYQVVGVVSGGPYLSKQGCKPYTIGANFTDITPKCERKCVPTYRAASYENDKNYGNIAYRIAHDVKQIQYEIMTFGSVQVGIFVGDDFFHYHSGVYQRHGPAFHGHSVRVLGWGVENGIDYWLCANSWGPRWGGLRGFFKIRRGTNECEIENSVVAGLPKLY